MSIQQVQELMGLINFNILAQPYQFAAYFAANCGRFLTPTNNPQFIYQTSGTRQRCFTDILLPRELQQLSQWRTSGTPRDLRTNQIYYIDRQRRLLQQLVDYWDAQFVPLVSGFSGSQSGGATLGPGFTRSKDFLKYRWVMTRPGGCPPPEIQLANNLPPQYRTLATGVRRLHRAQLRP